MFCKLGMRSQCNPIKRAFEKISIYIGNIITDIASKSTSQSFSSRCSFIPISNPSMYLWSETLVWQFSFPFSCVIWSAILFLEVSIIYRQWKSVPWCGISISQTIVSNTFNRSNAIYDLSVSINGRKSDQYQVYSLSDQDPSYLCPITTTIKMSELFRLPFLS